MDFFSKFTKTEQSKPVSDDNQAPDSTQPGLNSDLFNSAKVVTGAAQSYFTHQPESTYDNAEVAGAAANVLKAGSEYGKLDETQGVGKYVDQAETYLNEYKTSHTTAATTATTTDTGVDGGHDSIPTSTVTKTEEYSDKVPKYAGGDDVKVGTDPASDEYDQSEGGYKADDGLSKKTSGGGASTEDDKLYGGQSGGGYEEDTTEGFSKKPTSGVGITDASDESEQQYSQVEDTKEDNYSKKPSGGVTAVDTSDEYDQSGDGYENKNKSEDYSYKSSGGAAAKVDESGEGYEEDTAEGFPNKAAAVPGSYSTTGDDVSEKYSEESGGGGYGNFAKAAAADFLKK